MASTTRPERPAPKTFYDARLIWANFSGEARQYNDAGDRNFHIVLSPEDFEAMKAEGWNVKMKPATRIENGVRVLDPDAEPLLVLKVDVGFNPNARPPKVVLVTAGGRKQTTLGVHPDGSVHPEEINVLDLVEREKVDVIITGGVWGPNSNGEYGIKAWLKTIYVTQREDELEMVYAEAAGDLDEVGTIPGI